MVRHVVMWQFEDCISSLEREVIANTFKKELEALVGVIDGVVAIRVIIDTLSTSNFDMMLDSSFESVEAMADYQVHPAHNEVASLLKGKMKIRGCVDYREEM